MRLINKAPKERIPTNSDIYLNIYPTEDHMLDTSCAGVKCSNCFLWYRKYQCKEELVNDFISYITMDIRE